MKISRDRKIKWVVPLLLFIGIIIDAALPAIFPKAFISGPQIIVSHLSLYFLVTFAFYFRDSQILWISFVFGLLYDSYNTTLLGLFATLYFLIAYIILKVKKFFPKKAIINFMLFIVAITVIDFVVFVFYFELGMTNVVLSRFLVDRLGPTLIFNTVLSFLFYYPTKKILNWLGYEDYIIF